MNSDLLVIGDCSIDQYMEIDTPEISHDPKTNQTRMCFFHGSKVPVISFNQTLAGNAAHVGVGTGKLGLPTTIYTELGDDSYARQFIRAFKNYNINTKYCIKNKGTTTNIHAIIVYEAERTIFSYHEPRTYKLPFESLETPKWVYYTSLADGFEKFQKELVDYLKDNSEIVLAFNPGTFQLKAGVALLNNILELTHILFVNKQEACKLSGVELNEKIPTRELHEKLHKLGTKLTVMTDGPNGSSVFDGSEFIELEAPKIDVPVVDKTGAGDSYAAAFLSALHYKKTLREAMEWGNKNASHIVQRIGCIDGLLTKEEMDEK